MIYENFHQFTNCRRVWTQRNMHRFMQGSRHGRYPYRSANTIVIFSIMPHHKDTVRIQHNLMQRMRHNPSTHTSIFFIPRCFSTKELHIFPMIHTHLVATTAQCNFQGSLCLFSLHFHRIRSQSNAHTNGRRNVLRGC